MKQLTLSIIALFFLNITFSQDYSIEEIKVIQNLFGAQKKVVYEENMDLSGTNADTFWKLYNAYETDRKEIGEEKMQLLMKYEDKGGTVTEVQAKELLAQASKIRNAENGLIMNYVKRMSKENSSFVAAQFYQIEHYITDGIRFSLFDNINFVNKKQ